jgi:hypothetical protein
LTTDVKRHIPAGKRDLFLVVWYFRSLFFFFFFLFHAGSLESCIENNVKKKTRFALVTQKTSLVLLLLQRLPLFLFDLGTRSSASDASSESIEISISSGLGFDLVMGAESGRGSPESSLAGEASGQILAGDSGLR